MSRTDCRGIERDLHLLLDGELDGFGAESVHAHLTGCERCTLLFEVVRQNVVAHAWAQQGPHSFEFDDIDPDDVESILTADLPDFDALSDRLRTADLASVGTLLYEVLKAEFLYDYGDDLEADEAPIDDPRAERARGTDMVEELRDWYDDDEVDGVDLRAVGARFEPPPIDHTRLDRFIAAMDVVRRLARDLADKAAYYQAVAHVKARRPEEAERQLRALAEGCADPTLARFSRISLGALAIDQLNRPADAVTWLEASLAGDAFDAIVLFNLAKARWLVAGEHLTDDVSELIARARALDADLVDRHLRRPRERALRTALSLSR